jgi:hypothetical protein
MSPNSPAPDALVERHARAGRSLVAILHAIQDDAGYVPAGCVAPLAKALNLSRAEVHGVLTYYHHFRTAPPARVTIQMCRAERAAAWVAKRWPSMRRRAPVAGSTRRTAMLPTHTRRPTSPSNRCTAWGCARNRRR